MFATAAAASVLIGFLADKSQPQASNTEYPSSTAKVLAATSAEGNAQKKATTGFRFSLTGAANYIFELGKSKTRNLRNRNDKTNIEHRKSSSVNLNQK